MTSWNVEFNDKMIPIDKNSFSFTTEGDVVAFDFAYITIHGAPPGGRWETARLLRYAWHPPLLQLWRACISADLQ